MDTVSKKGFTLLEILLVVAAVGILAAIVIVAINPGRQLDQVEAASVQREANALLNSLEQYLIDNNRYPDEIEGLSNTETALICAEGIDEATCVSEGLLFLEDDLVPTYIAQVPAQDTLNPNSSGYGIVKNGSTVGIYAIRNPESQDPDSIVLGADLDDYIAGIDGKLLWLKSDAGVTEDIGGVSVWEDQSGQGNHFRQAVSGSQPDIVDDALGGVPGVEFDGLDDHLISDNYLYAADQEFTMIFVTQAIASSNTQPYLFDFGNFQNRHYGVALSPTAFTISTPGDFGGSYNSIFDDYSGYNLLTANIVFGDSQNFKVNKEFIRTVSITTSGLTATEIAEDPDRESGEGPPVLGIQSKTFSDSNRKFRGIMVEVLFIEGALSDQELTIIEDVIMTKYGL